MPRIPGRDRVALYLLASDDEPDVPAGAGQLRHQTFCSGQPTATVISSPLSR